MGGTLEQLLERSASRHDHLCPRQVLGVRMGIAGLKQLDLSAPINKSTGLVIVETDGCFVDGIEVSTGATVGHRTLRVNDYGKISATFVNVSTGQALRFAPRPEVRTRACMYASATDDRYITQLEGYRWMPANELFDWRAVELTPSLEAVIGRAEVRVSCSACGEEIFNEREVRLGGVVLCKSCADGGYYAFAAEQSRRCQIEQVGWPQR